MEQLNNLVGQTVIQLNQQRRLRREQHEDGFGSGRIIDADISGSESFLVSLHPVQHMQPSVSESHSRSPLPEPQPASTNTCPLCQDRGYLRVDVPIGHPQFGKPVECRCKRVYKQETLRQRLREQSKLDELLVFQEETFASFQFWLPGVGQAFDAAKQFAEEPRGWLVLAGNNGCGKTHLAVAIARSCLEQGRVVLFAVVPDLLDHLRAAFKPTAEETFDEEFARMREATVLILDDLGAESSTSWAAEKLFQLLNYRYNAQLATVFTTNNLHFEGIAPRLRSRLSDRRLVKMVNMATAQDFRVLVQEE